MGAVCCCWITEPEGIGEDIFFPIPERVNMGDIMNLAVRLSGVN